MGHKRPRVNSYIDTDGAELTETSRHFYFTKLLVPLLQEGAKTSPDGHARVINTSSSTAEAGSIKFDTFRDSQARRKLGGVRLYMQSKLVSSPYYSFRLSHLFMVHSRAASSSPMSSPGGTPTRG
jgi:NAD(P)-dependent dehydrogenase (short-subunit alcohol dehydrogenase family)